jgi:hypothetical protein
MAMQMRIPLWPLPLGVAVVLVSAAHLALALSIADGLVPACVPYVEGCTSISRAARHGLANPVFRLLVLPCAMLVAAHWWLSARWLQARGARAGGMAIAGALAAVALAVYAAFLGSDGEVYRFLRRHGVVVFFGGSFLAQVLFLRALARIRPHDRGLRLALQGVCVAMLLLGAIHAVALAAIGGSPRQDRLENALEWQLGALLVAWYMVQALAWHRDGSRLGMELRSGTGS